MVQVIKCNACGKDIPKADKKWSGNFRFYKEKHSENYAFDLCSDCVKEIIKSFKLPPDTSDC